MIALATAGGATGADWPTTSPAAASRATRSFRSPARPGEASRSSTRRAARRASSTSTAPPSRRPRRPTWRPRPPASGAPHAVVVISGSLPPGLEPDTVAALVAELIAAGVAVVVDTSGPGLMAAARAGATVLKPNRDELAAVTGVTDPVAGARALLDAGARLVVVSLGAEGLLVLTGRARPGASAPACRSRCTATRPAPATPRWPRSPPPSPSTPSCAPPVTPTRPTRAGPTRRARRHGPPRDRVVGLGRAHAARRRPLARTRRPRGRGRRHRPRSPTESA